MRWKQIVKFYHSTKEKLSWNGPYTCCYKHEYVRQKCRKRFQSPLMFINYRYNSTSRVRWGVLGSSRYIKITVSLMYFRPLPPLITWWMSDILCSFFNVYCCYKLIHMVEYITYYVAQSLLPTVCKPCQILD